MPVNLQNIPVLLLNASYEGINVISARRAFTLVMKGVAAVEQSSAKTIHTGRRRSDNERVSLRVPSVIRLLSYRKIPRLSRVLSRKSILTRDAHTCQYCGAADQRDKLTLDHIIPQSRGGPDTWENLVTCCKPCNNRKAARTPAEAGMPLARYPKPFTVHTSRHLLREAGLQQQDWQPYLFYDTLVK